MKFRFTLDHQFAAALGVMALSILTACGGGGGEPVAAAALIERGTLATAVEVSGTSTGFDRVIVDGVK